MTLEAPWPRVSGGGDSVSYYLVLADSKCHKRLPIKQRPKTAFKNCLTPGNRKHHFGLEIGERGSPSHGQHRPNVFDSGQQGEDVGQVQPPGRPHPVMTDSMNKNLPQMKLDVQLNIGTNCLRGNLSSPW